MIPRRIGGTSNPIFGHLRASRRLTLDLEVGVMTSRRDPNPRNVM